MSEPQGARRASAGELTLVHTTKAAVLGGTSRADEVVASQHVHANVEGGAGSGPYRPGMGK
eukprot:365159-Chlamydomonas_euryale.AAC.29